MSELLKALLALVPESWVQAALAIAVAIVAGIPLVFKLWRDFGDHRHAVTLKRPMDRVLQLADAASPETELATALQRLKEAEIFAIAFGVRASPIRVAALTRMYNTGLFSPTALRILAHFVDGGSEPAVRLVIGRGDRWAARTSTFAMVVLTLYYFLLLFQLFRAATPGAVVASLVLGVVWLALMIVFGREVRALYLAEDAQKHLEKLGLLAPAE